MSTPTRVCVLALTLMAASACGSGGSSPKARNAPGAGGTNTGGTGGTSSGTGGTAGGVDVIPENPAPEPHTVAKCDGLPDVGQWEKVGPDDGSSAEPLTVFAAVSPTHSGVVYTSVGSWEGTRAFYRSTDCGETWTKAGEGRNAMAISSGFLWSMAVDSTNGNVIFGVNGYGGPPSLFKTIDGGDNWSLLFQAGSEAAAATTGNFVQGVAMDPTNSRHLFVTFHDNCVGDYAPMCLAESTDAGLTWRVFKGPTDGWEEGASPIVLNETDLLYAAPFDGLYLTTDNGDSWNKVSDSGYGQIYQTEDGRMFLGSNNGVQLSEDDGHTWTLIPNSPKASGIIGDGTTIYACFQNDFGGKPFYSAPEADPSTWTNVETPSMSQGAPFLSYDADHHVLDGGAYKAGLWRLVTK